MNETAAALTPSDALGVTIWRHSGCTIIYLMHMRIFSGITVQRVSA